MKDASLGIETNWTLLLLRHKDRNTTLVSNTFIVQHVRACVYEPTSGPPPQWSEDDWQGTTLQEPMAGHGPDPCLITGLQAMVLGDKGEGRGRSGFHKSVGSLPT